MLRRMMAVPAAKRAARGLADWVDLPWWFLVRSLSRMAPLARGRLLDVGCGDKPYEHLFAPYVDEYIGIEHEATYNLTSAGSRGKADLRYDGETLPFEDASFDTVLCAQVLEHTPTPRRIVSEIARVLRPGGLAIISAPFSFRLHEEPHDYYRFSPHGLRELCGPVGLDIETIEAQGGLWSVIAHKVNGYLALRVADVGGFAQSLGKCAHELDVPQRGLGWKVAAVAPAMVAISAAARLGDYALDDPTDSLGFTVLARRR